MNVREGDNRPPHLIHEQAAADLLIEADNWLDGRPVDEATAGGLDKLVKAAKAAKKAADSDRVEAKRPHKEAGDAIQALYNPITKRLDKIVAKANEALTPYRAAQVAAKRAEAQRLADLAAKAKAKADAKVAARTGFESRVKADDAIEAAKDAERRAARVAKQAEVKKGTRTVWGATLTDERAAFDHYWTKAPDQFRALVMQLAATDVRAGRRDIPGFIVASEEVAV